MTGLNFSEAITLPYGQTMSVVVDGVVGKEGEPQIVNYGLIKNGDEDFSLKCRIVPLNSSRDLTVIGSDGEAKTVLNINCATNLDNIKSSQTTSEGLFGFTVKSFPHYGAYGYVNYDGGESSSYQYGVTLDKSRNGGNIF